MVEHAENMKELKNTQKENNRAKEIVFFTPLKNKKKKRNPKKYDTKEISLKPVLKPICFRCGAEGVSVQDFYLQCAVAMEKAQLMGENINFFELPIQIKKFISKEFQTPIILVDASKKPEIIEKIKYKFRTMVQFAGFVALCPKCMKDLNLEESYRDQIEKRRPKLDLQTMHFIGSMMQPELEKIAREQLKNEGVDIK